MVTDVNTPATVRLTVARFLFDRDTEALDLAARRLVDSGAVARLGRGLPTLSPRAADLVGRRIASVAARAADIDVGAVAMNAWSKHRALVDAAFRTLEDAGSEALVHLSTHTVNSTHEPHVDVLVDELRIGTVPLVIELELVVHSLAATVRDGHLARLDTGRCELGARLLCHGVVLAHREDELDHVLEIPLGAGIALAGPRALAA
ncbi:MAG TPA: hypothetical protein VFZ70_00050 [Euzebyales bacterium]